MYTCGTWTLYLDAPSLAPTSVRRASHRYIGPPIWSPTVPLPPELKFENRHWPLIYVTLGSSGDTRVLKPLINVLHSIQTNVIIATAGRVHLGDLPANIAAVPLAPAKEILQRASACIFNGGSATGYQALSAGVPLLSFPSNADQFYFSEAVQRAGAGLIIRPSTAGLPEIAASIHALLGQPSFRHAAQKLQREIDSMSVADRFRQFVESVAILETQFVHATASLSDA